MIELRNALAKSRHETRERMVRKNPKYRFWLPMMQYSGVLIGNRKGQMLEADYLWMRTVDDIVDGDIPAPSSDSTAQYIEEKLAFLDDPGTPRDDIDALILFCEELSRETGISLQEERKLILRSMLFDAQRFGKYQIFSKQDLDEHFYRCDIEGTGKGALKLFEDPEKWRYVEPLGVASRIYDNLHDLPNDIASGYINIPKEDIDRFGISKLDLRDINSPNLQEWISSEVTRGQQLLEQDKELFPHGNFSPIGRVFVHFYHRLPTKNYLTQILPAI